MRFCVDHRALNKQTVRNFFPIPHIDVLIDKTQGSRVFTTLDLRSAYSQVRIYKPDVPKTAFVTPFEHFEYLVVPFGLTNAPSTFQTLMNSLLGHLPFVCVYLDDILIFSKDEKQHLEHLRQVLSILRQNTLFAKLGKCKFFQSSVEFLGHVISHDGVRPSPDKVSAVATWPAPKTLKALQSFLGFVNFYRRFIPNFAQISVPLTKLLAKNAAYNWNTKCQEAFDTLRDSLLCEPLIKHYDPSLPTRVETDSSGYAIGAVLAQEHKDGWHPVAFLSRTMTSHERDYLIQEQELLALIYALKK